MIGQQHHIINPSVDGIMDIKNTFKITTINVQGLNNSMKQEQLINYMDINKIDILCVNETKLKQKMADVIYKNNRNVLSWWSCNDENSFATGTSIIMTKDTARYLQKITRYDGRMIQATFFLKGKISLTILSVYNFAHDKEKKQKLELYDKINEIITLETKLQAKIIMLGDFNIDYEIMKKEILQNHNLKWKFKLFSILSKFNFKDVSKLFHIG